MVDRDAGKIGTIGRGHPGMMGGNPGMLGGKIGLPDPGGSGGSGSGSHGQSSSVSTRRYSGYPSSPIRTQISTMWPYSQIASTNSKPCSGGYGGGSCCFGGCEQVVPSFS